MKIALLLSLLSSVTYAQFKVVPVHSVSVEAAVGPILILAEGPIKICRYSNLQEPCFSTSKSKDFTGELWSDGNPIYGIGSVQVTNDFYRASLVIGENTTTIKKEDGIVNLGSRFERVDIINAPLRICAQDYCRYSWTNATTLQHTPFYKNITSLTVSSGYEVTLCTEAYGRGTCRNYINYNKVDNFTLPTASYYTWKHEADAPMKICVHNNLKGRCAYPRESDMHTQDNKIVPSAQYHSIYLDKGHEATICSRANLQGVCTDVRGPLLHQANDGFRSFEFRKKFTNWYQYVYERNFPHDAEVDWGDNTNQGVTHSDTHWYFTTTDKIMMWPISQRLTQGSALSKRHLPHSCKHFGDIDYYKGRIYVPLEQCKGGSEKARRIYVYDTVLSMIRYGYLSTAGHASWAAINPVNGLLYSSEFYDGKYGTTIDVYDPNFTSGTKIKKLYEVKLSHGLKRIQGGAISKNGNLYLVSDNRYSTNNAGIYMYRIEGKKARFVHKISTNGLSPGWPNYEEMEGMTIWNVDDKNISGMPSGHIHWVLNVNDIGHNDLYFKHISVTNPENL